MAQKTLKINIFPVFSLLIREFWIKNISILLQILHTPFFSSQNPFIRCCSVGQIPPRYRACKAVFLPPLTPRINGFLFEKFPGLRLIESF